MSTDSYIAYQDLVKENARLKEYNVQLEQRLADAGQTVLVQREICANCEIERTVRDNRQTTDQHFFGYGTSGDSV